MKTTRIFRTVLGLALLLLLTFACTEQIDEVEPKAPLVVGTEQDAMGMNSKVTPVAGGITIDAVRKALNRYQNLEMAEKAGYVRSGDCISSSAGGMGIHWYNDALISPTLHPMHPELLVYVPDGSGGMRLVAAEYFVWEEDWKRLHGENAPLPTMFGQTFIRGTHGLPPHYELHAWLWAENPSGMFSNWNPTITCQ
jgi:hypothetical protein